MVSLLLAAILQTRSSVAPYHPHGPELRFTMENGKSFVITTDPQASPKTVAQIVMLVRNGFYDRQRIHRVENWVTQWGAPASRTKPLGSAAVTDGGYGKALPFEMSEVDYVRGVVGIASEGLQMGGDSQIFILKKDAMRLYHSYAVVGKVTQGMETVDAIKKGDRIRSAYVIGSHSISRRRHRGN